MERWNTIERKTVVNKDIDVFISEIVDVCKKHDMSISHQDIGGAFTIEKYLQRNINWLNTAHDCIKRS